MVSPKTDVSEFKDIQPVKTIEEARGSSTFEGVPKTKEEFRRLLLATLFQLGVTVWDSPPEATILTIRKSGTTTRAVGAGAPVELPMGDLPLLVKDQVRILKILFLKRDSTKRLYPGDLTPHQVQMVEHQSGLLLILCEPEEPKGQPYEVVLLASAGILRIKGKELHLSENRARFTFALIKPIFAAAVRRFTWQEMRDGALARYVRDCLSEGVPPPSPPAESPPPEPTPPRKVPVKLAAKPPEKSANGGATAGLEAVGLDDAFLWLFRDISEDLPLWNFLLKRREATLLQLIEGIKQQPQEMQPILDRLQRRGAIQVVKEGTVFGYRFFPLAPLVQRMRTLFQAILKLMPANLAPSETHSLEMLAGLLKDVLTAKARVKVFGALLRNEPVTLAQMARREKMELKTLPPYLARLVGHGVALERGDLESRTYQLNLDSPKVAMLKGFFEQQLHLLDVAVATLPAIPPLEEVALGVRVPKESAAQVKESKKIIAQKKAPATQVGGSSPAPQPPLSTPSKSPGAPAPSPPVLEGSPMVMKSILQTLAKLGESTLVTITQQTGLDPQTVRSALDACIQKGIVQGRVVYMLNSTPLTQLASEHPPPSPEAPVHPLIQQVSKVTEAPPSVRKESPKRPPAKELSSPEEPAPVKEVKIPEISPIERPPKKDSKVVILSTLGYHPEPVIGAFRTLAAREILVLHDFGKGTKLGSIFKKLQQDIPATSKPQIQEAHELDLGALRKYIHTWIQEKAKAGYTVYLNLSGGSQRLTVAVLLAAYMCFDKLAGLLYTESHEPMLLPIFPWRPSEVPPPVSYIKGQLDLTPILLSLKTSALEPARPPTSTNGRGKVLITSFGSQIDPISRTIKELGASKAIIIHNYEPRQEPPLLEKLTKSVSIPLVPQSIYKKGIGETLVFLYDLICQESQTGASVLLNLSGGADKVVIAVMLASYLTSDKLAGFTYAPADGLPVPLPLLPWQFEVKNNGERTYSE